MKRRLPKLPILLILVAVVFVSDAALGQSRARARARGSVCGNPKVPCKTSVTFEPHDLPFRVPQNAVIWDTELFYAIILRSMDVGEENCEKFFPESERLETQALFPQNKVFTSRCFEPGYLFYTNVDWKYRIIGVYAGKTLPEAKRMLETVKATGKFPGANIRRMRTGFNGT